MPDENILANVSRPYFLDTHEIFCTCSIGIIVFAETHCEVSDVCSKPTLHFLKRRLLRKTKSGFSHRSRTQP